MPFQYEANLLYIIPHWHLAFEWCYFLSAYFSCIWHASVFEGVFWSLHLSISWWFLLYLYWLILVCRKVRHKNVVQFIGACTQPPNLCIVTGKYTRIFNNIDTVYSRFLFVTSISHSWCYYYLLLPLSFWNWIQKVLPFLYVRFIMCFYCFICRTFHPTYWYQFWMLMLYQNLCHEEVSMTSCINRGASLSFHFYSK